MHFYIVSIQSILSILSIIISIYLFYNPKILSRAPFSLSEVVPLLYKLPKNVERKTRSYIYIVGDGGF